MCRAAARLCVCSSSPPVAAVVLLLLTAAAAAAQQGPIKLHPDNPHYFSFRGKPTILLTCGEHYGAVLNRDFDYVRYLDELKARGFNLTRTFSGVYREVPGSFKIENNTLAPKPERFVCPWPRTATPGAADGNKFDLTKWDPAYFARLKDFLAQAGKRGIVVEFVLFCPFYEETMWQVDPMNAANNVNGIGKVPRTEVYTTKHKGLLAVHEAFVRKVVAELQSFDNLYYEVCNEPYFGGVTLAWQERIIAAIVDAEKELPHRHLIAQNISNGSTKVKDPNKHVSIFNFHYSTPPNSVAMNHDLNRAIGDDETGFKGTADLPYRTEGWDFIVAGGAVYSNLDYSFTVAHPDGTAMVKTSPGGGGPSLRKQLQILKEFIDGFDFLKMKPDNAVIKGGVPAKATARALVERGKAYAVYVKGGAEAKLVLELPAGSYLAEWVDTRSGAVAKREEFRHAGGERMLASPRDAEDNALRIRRSGE
jgi:hypothetical protein